MREEDFKKTFGVEPYLPYKDGLLYKYFSCERGIEAITSQALWFSQAKMLNDAYELDTDKIRFNINDENIRNLLSRYVHDENFREKMFEDSKTNRLLIPEVMKKGLNQMRDECGICCFSQNPRQLLMWGLYGVSDTGICIGFDLPIISNLSKEMFLMKVLYENERSFIEYFDRPHSIFPFWGFVKNSSWQHEEEIRAFHLNYHGLINIELSSIKEIHYGRKATEETRGSIESYMAIRDYYDYNSYNIVNSKMDYSLISSPLKIKH